MLSRHEHMRLSERERDIIVLISNDKRHKNNIIYINNVNVYCGGRREPHTKRRLGKGERERN